MSNKTNQLTIWHADTNGNKQNCFYQQEVHVTDRETLRHALGYDHVFVKFRDNKRGNENFLYADFLVLDCDNDHSDDQAEWIWPEDLADFLPEVKFITYSSRHNNMAKESRSPRPRFHVIFPIEHTESAEEYAKLKRKAAEMLPFFDSNALDAGRFFFGVYNPEIYAHQGEKNLTEWMQDEERSDLVCQNDIIPEGKRNSTLSAFAGRLIKRCGNTDEAYEAFRKEGERCSPPLPEKEIEEIWKSAQKYYQAISARPDYIQPDQYGRIKNTEWEEPIPLTDDDLPEFPTDTLPPVIAAYCKAVAETLQIPVGMAASCALGMLSICLQKNYKVRINPTWTEPVHLYILIVADPSEKKSPCVKLMCYPLIEYEEKWNRDHAAAIRASQEMKCALAISVENIKKAIAKGKATEEDLQEAVERELAYTVQEELQLFLDDVTPEKLISQMADNGGVCAIVSSEGGVFDNFAGRYSGFANIDVLLKSYSGDTLKVSRSTKGNEVIYSPALTILDMMQHNALAGIMNNPVFRERGLTARILYCIPKSKIGYRNSNPEPVDLGIQKNYEELMIGLLSEKHSRKETITLSEEAERERIAFDEEIEKKSLDEYADFRDWTGKIVGTTIRIAALLYLASEERVNAKEKNEMPGYVISGEVMRDAIRIARYYIAHMMFAYRNSGTELMTKNCRKAISALLKRNKEAFTVRDLMRYCHFKSAELAQAVADHLEDLGYVKAQDPEPYRKPGRPTKSKYTVYPELLRQGQTGA